MARARFTDRDRGAKALIKRTEKGGPALVVGLVGDAAAQKAIDGKGLTVGDLGNAHEFGLGPPERSFIRAPIDGATPQIQADLRTAAKAVKEGRFTRERALDLLGFRIVGLIQETMAGGIPPPLSANYLPRKLAKYPGATTPLIASGQLRGAVTHQLRPKS